MGKFSLAVHGGAGTVAKANLTPGLEEKFHAGLRAALNAGCEILSAGGSGLDAVTAAVCAFEDDPLFNAGCGAVFTSDGKQEMDAAVMDGATRAAGAVGGIFGPRNPIRAARAVMELTDNVMLIGPSAMSVAHQAGLPFAEADYFFTQARWDALQSTLQMRAEGIEDDDPARRHGTVGAVACDTHGTVAAATSTGGLTAKTPGRIGDTPIIGAGTFADNATCAVSATGTGEVFMRYTAAAEIAARMRHAGQSLEEAATHVVMHDLAENGGSGGVIAVDSQGNITMPFNCDGMYRGMVTQEGLFNTYIFR